MDTSTLYTGYDILMSFELTFNKQSYKAALRLDLKTRLETSKQSHTKNLASDADGIYDSYRPLACAGNTRITAQNPSAVS
jgi:hypothetical protein